MTDHQDLHDLLELSTDRIESPDLVALALTGARRRRTTHRAVAVSVAVVAVVAGVAVTGSLVDRDGNSGGPVEQPSPTVVTQGPFDPAHVDALPSITDDVGPALSDIPEVPAVIELPAVSPWLADDPMDSAVLAFWGEDGVALMSPDGDWRSVPIEGIYGGAELTRDGTRIAVTTEAGVDVWDLPTGERTQFERPAAFPVTDQDYGWWRWLDDRTLFLDDPREGEGGWLVDSTSGESTRVAYPLSREVTVDPEGALVEVPEVDRLFTIKASAEHVVGIHDYSVVVADRADLTPLVELPFVDPESSFSDGKMPVVAILDNGTVLLQVPVFGGDFSWRLVAWDPASGRLAGVLRMDGAVPSSYAVGLLG